MTIHSSDKRNIQIHQKPDTDKTERASGKTKTGEGDSAHMGATEDQVIPLTPPTEAFEKLMDDSSEGSSQQTADDGLTPG